ncbi:MAG: DUF1800 domain-containing protein [Phycisphaeraceae bacterium]|nr:DUF1800 family protein [Phycisphaerales bacterium]QOJ18010.1 MAG: DUF1800 domain-containing protein [Phycisphaeraceae bacterium]
MPTTRRDFVRLLGAGGVAGGLATALAGCDDAVDSLAVALDPGSDDFRPPSAAEIDDASHVINRLTYGPRPGDHARVSQMGVRAFINEQLHPEKIGDRRAEWKVNGLESIHASRGDLFSHHPRQLLQDLTRAKLMRAVYSRRQLYEVMVDFWTDHFNIVMSKDQCRWLKAADDREVIREHALGDFRTLLRASALSPAMLIYLDGHDNKVARPDDRPNENYARELLELHTLGVHGGYTQQDVMEVARCLSGWTYGHSFLRPDRVSFNPDFHDDGEKTVLGVHIPAGGGASDLDRVLRIVCDHPATARHIAWKLCRRFIADEPPAEAVQAVAAALTSNEWSIRAGLQALFETEAFWTMRGGMFKRPFHFVASALRAVEATTDCGPRLIEYLERMGHAPFQYPTPDGYPIEPQPWMGTLLWRWNFVLALEGRRLRGTSFDGEALVRRIGSREGVAAHALGRALTESERQVIEASEHPVSLLLASPAFQRC